MILDEFRRRPGEVFQVGDEELLRIFPDLKRSALSWSLWSLCQKGYIQKLRLRINSRLTTVFGVPKAIGQLKTRLDQAAAFDKEADDQGDSSQYDVPGNVTKLHDDETATETDIDSIDDSLTVKVN
jgi:hypothetical protein